MHGFASKPPVTARQRAVELAGLAAVAPTLWLAWRAATRAVGHGQPPTVALRVFFVASLVAVAAICVWPLWGSRREARLWRHHRALVARCPACGAAGEGSAGCARCGFPAGYGGGWRLVAVDPFAAVFMVGGAVALGGLAGMFFLGMRDAETRFVQGTLLVLGALLSGGGIASVAGAVGLLRGALRTPPRFAWRRTWTRGADHAYTEAEVVAAPVGALASGSTVVHLPAVVEGARADGDATDFERGLAAVFLRWETQGLAERSLERRLTWRWPAGPPGAPGDAVYRAPAAGGDDVAREETEAWSVSFNQHSFADCLEAVGLPPPASRDDDDEAYELAEADWSVACAVVARVMAADPALRAAVEARADSVDPGEPGYAAALLAARSR